MLRTLSAKSQVVWPDDERQALRAEGLDPDDPAVVAAIDLVRWELSLVALRLAHRGRAGEDAAVDW